MRRATKTAISPPSPTSGPTSGEQRRVIERYVLFEQIGAGGMGTVHRALDEVTGRVVAFKQLNAAIPSHRRSVANALFQHEYHTLVRLKHPRIIEVYDYGLTETGPYYTMELLTGEDLSELGTVSLEMACRYLRDIASSLALIHAHRLVHRDVSARNIRLTDEHRAKLLDFGALSPFGVADQIVGTPVCIAPEVMLRQPIDQRTDLYALGVVAYWLLTGHHAYPARHSSELYTAWRTPPIQPSLLNPEIPRAMEALMVSLLSLDPLGRPPNAAAVIDQLTALGRLEPEEHEQAAESYLLSSRMVGRKREIECVDHCLERAVGGQGAEIVIEGAAGIGKTRLLNEACLEAQLRGALVLKADAQASAEPFGVAVSLGVGLLEACPELGRRALGEQADLLAQLSPRLRERLGDAPSTSVAQEAGERRARFQAALHQWFVAAARERLLFLAIDNLQAADDDSAAFIAACGRESRRLQLVIVATQRTGEPAIARAALRTLRQRARRLKLAALDLEACELLVKSLFGDVPSSGRVARLLFEKSAGAPRQCMDLAQLLVKKKIAKYAAGTWVLPQDVAADELPSKAEELFAARLGGLSAEARLVAEVLSIHATPVSLERCLTLVEGLNESETHAAIDELVAEQILEIDGAWYRFSNEELRHAVAAHMDDARRRAHHVTAAEAILASDPDTGARIDAAVHLLDAGEESRGAEILAKLGMSLPSSVDYNAGSEAVAALQRALAIFERQGRSEYELAALLLPMMKLAYYTPHWTLILEYGERALEIGLHITGLALAHSLRPALGRKLGLGIGLGIGAARFAKQKSRGLSYDFETAIVMSCAVVPAVAGTAATCLDTDRVARISRVVEPLRLFGPEHVAGIMHAWVPMQLLTVLGREGEACEMIARCIELNRQPHIREAMGEANWRTQYGGLLFIRGLFDAYAFGDEALRGAEELEQTGIRVWAMAANQIRMLYHACRGESEEVQRYRECVEVLAVQGSTTWQAEMFWPALLLNADVLCGDAIATRRASELLARRAKHVHVLQKFADAAHAAYLMLRGELGAAIALYERILPEFPLRRRVSYETTRAYYARALNLAGQHARAKAVVREVIDGMVPQDRRLAVHFLELERQLALAEAGLGNTADAVRILDALLAEHGQKDNRLLVGLLHEARAEIALLMRDLSTFELHERHVEERFKSTRNPALIAQWERLVESAQGSGLYKIERRAPDLDPSFDLQSAITLSEGFSDPSADSEPFDAAAPRATRPPTE